MLRSENPFDVSEYEMEGSDDKNTVQISNLQVSANFHESFPRAFSPNLINDKKLLESLWVSDLSHRRLESLDSVPNSRIVPNKCEKDVCLLLNDNSLTFFNITGMDLSKIVMLELSFNAIRWLCFEMDCYPNLKALSAASNKIDRLTEKFFGRKPHENLESLDLSNNLIEVLPKSIKNFKNLTHLRLTKNPIDKVPIDIKELVHLRTFSLDWWDFCPPVGNGIEVETVFKFFAILHRFSKKKRDSITFIDTLNEFSLKPIAKLACSEQFRMVSQAIKHKQNALVRSFMDFLPQIIHFKKNQSESTVTPIDLLYKAVRWDNEEIVNRIMERDQPSFKYEDNLLLYTAIEYSSPDIVLALLKKGADPNKISKIPEVLLTSPLSYAMQHKDKEKMSKTIKFLLEFGANPWVHNEKSKNAWHFAILSCNQEGLDQLVNMIPKKELNDHFHDQIISASGNTMLHLAAGSYSFEIILKLLSLLDNQDLYENTSHLIPVEVVPSKRVPVKKLFLKSFKKCVLSIYEQFHPKHSSPRFMQSTNAMKLDASKKPEEKKVTAYHLIDLTFFRKRQLTKLKYVDPVTLAKPTTDSSVFKRSSERNLKISNSLQFGDFVDIEEHPENEEVAKTSGYVTGKTRNFSFDGTNLLNRRPLSSCRSMGVGFSFKEINTLSGFMTKLENKAFLELAKNPKSKSKLTLLSCNLGRSSLYSFFGKGKLQKDGIELSELLQEIDRSGMSCRNLEVISDAALVCLKRLGVLLGIKYIFEGSSEQVILQQFYQRDYRHMGSQNKEEQGELTTDSFGFLLIRILEAGMEVKGPFNDAQSFNDYYLSTIFTLGILRTVLDNSWFIQDSSPVSALFRPKQSPVEGLEKQEKESKDVYSSNLAWSLFLNNKLVSFEMLAWLQANSLKKVDWSVYFPKTPLKKRPVLPHKELRLDIKEEPLEELESGSFGHFAQEARSVQTPSLRVNKTNPYFS